MWDGGGAGGRSGKGEGEQREGRLRKLVGLAQKPVTGDGQDTATGILSILICGPTKILIQKIS